MKQLILWISVLCMFSCTRNPGLERTYRRAGANRAELEKVLRHYEGDGRKHHAALFLLERMSDCYSYADPLIDSLQELRYLSSLPDRGSWTDSVKKVWGHVFVRNSPRVYDAQVILGRLTALADSLVYNNVLGNAVLWLRDLTKGKEEQQFILDNDGEQVFH